MTQKITTTFLIVLTFAIHTTFSQNINAKIVDSISQKPIPFATIQWSVDKGIITNDDGEFNLIVDKNTQPKDSVYISSMGYTTLGKTFEQLTDSIIYLSPNTIALNNVIVSNKNYTAEEIIDFVKDNIEGNYNRAFTKKRIFLRQRYYQNMHKTNYSDLESTITAFNSSFLDSVIATVPKSEERYTESLFDLYGNYEDENQKIDLIKASELYDKNSELDVKKLEQRFNKIIKENVKTTSYFKVKSGIFGSKVESGLITSENDSTDVEALNKKLEEEQKRKENRKLYFAQSIKNDVSKKFANLFFMDNTNLNFITKSRKYEFTLIEYAYLGNTPVYVINFKPKNNADYQGTLYINPDDFAVVRVDYENTQSIKTFKLLGISMNQYLAKGKIIFYKDANNKYNLRYLEHENGSKVGINRPLKIIEKNKVVKGKNKQNELSLKMDLGFTGTNKYEIVVFDTEKSSQNTFDSFTENNTILPTYMPSYDPEFWKGYNIIEPNTAIKTFTSKETK
ncbi:carboxypeptidase-like regulatory domain-containing protein [Cellulophaga baltica]|uniref:carboxypeptidase-like regulatory domain-containing protein n=1 Tax=Cellulophaga TaxID=104264 RepID=UPI001C07D939|nr:MULTISPECIES: carboxypeptidase-like regulatory domain-containing protein [Cellulophaga]MBU2997696.1 carboxypeptidase-like regulatory domain-containing protein [Cellulophaga baltica]MDO6769091.1 carboxypeptidase-like regulatory domain-containing protein [Cellulophaga sp. 1_MG-2023]